MTYVDGFVMVVKKKNIKAYQKMAKDAGKIWRKHGALQYVETVGEDLKPNMGPPEGAPDMGKPMTFPKLARTGKDETVVFSFIIYKSRKHRDQVNAKVMKDMDKSMEKYKDMKMPFDVTKMAYGGFESLVDL